MTWKNILKTLRRYLVDSTIFSVFKIWNYEARACVKWGRILRLSVEKRLIFQHWEPLAIFLSRDYFSESHLGLLDDNLQDADLIFLCSDIRWEDVHIIFINRTFLSSKKIRYFYTWVSDLETYCGSFRYGPLMIVRNLHTLPKIGARVASPKFA